jgi:HlyD family secretion protein
MALSAVFVMWYNGVLFGKQPFNGPTWTVKKEVLKITIIARGSLESASNGDINCTVRSGTKGSTIASTIRWLIDNGTEVHKGEKVMELDDSGFKEQLKDQNIKVDQAEANWVQAKEQYKIQESQNESDIKQANNALELAKIDLEKYVKGDYVQSIKDVDGRILTSKSDLEDWKDRAAWSKRMAKKGLMSQVQADADASRAEAQRIALEKLFEERRVLEDFTKKRTVQDLTAKLDEAKSALQRVTLQAKAKLVAAESDRSSKKSIYEQELSRKREVEAEIAKCVILAPQNGLVVYYVPEQVRGGGGSQQSIVAQGEPVREGQKMLQIPDLTKMQVSVRVPEAQVSYLHNEEDVTNKSSWQIAAIRVDAFSSQTLPGHVKTVDTVASAQDFFASDVKVYKTIVTIDQQREGLRPGMSAEVVINAEDSGKAVLVVPVQAVIGSISMGAQRKCFVVGPDHQPHLRDITVGMSNERMVEVKTGLEEGEVVVQNPQKLLSDDSDMKPGKARVRADADADGGKGDDKKGDKGKKKGAGPAGAQQIGGMADPAQKAQMEQAFMEKMQSATPEQRRDIINSIPEQFREAARTKLRSKGMDVAD